MSTYSRRQVLKHSLAAAGVVGLSRGVGLSSEDEASPVASPSAADASGPQSQPPISTRMFWTWDHSTEWLLSIASGFDTISLFGEVSPFHTGAELNYLTLADYGSAANPAADLRLFLRQVAAPLLGGERYAKDYLRYARLLDNRAKIPAAPEEIRGRVADPPYATCE